jgi:superfamily II DNA or RNA helicase
MGANVELAASTLATLRDDPLLAWRSWFSEDLWPRGWQIEALEDWRNPRNRRLAYVTARGAGKSRFAAFCILHDAATRHEGLILIVSPSERQRRVSTWQAASPPTAMARIRRAAIRWCPGWFANWC